MTSKPPKRPLLGLAVRFLCPYCGKTPLRDFGAYWTFARGCKSCDYRFEREIGYYTGASWMVTLPVISLLAFALAGLLLWRAPGLGAMTIVAIAAVSMLLAGLVLTPFCMALWLYIEHSFRPLNSDDSYDKELLK